MAKPELGMKRVCVACATRFYDLARTPAVCPKCGTEQPTEQPRARRTGGNVADEKRLKKVVAPGLEDPDVEIETAEEEAEEEEEKFVEKSFGTSESNAQKCVFDA